jgi:hypothetical protein
MPRYIFSPSNVATGGREAAVTVFLSETDNRRVTDLWRIDGSDFLSEAIPNGIISTPADGAVGAFAGPDDCDTLYIQVGSSGSRSPIQAVRQSLAQPRVIGDLAVLPDSLTQLMRVEIPDDGSPTSTWPDRLVFFYVDPVDGLVRTGYFNEYGEVRGRSAKQNTVAGRFLAHEDNTTAPIFQVTDHLQGALYLSVSKERVSSVVPFSGPNVPVDRIRTSDATPINNNTVLVTDGVMQFAATAGTYIVDGVLVYDCSATADLKMRFAYSGTGTGMFAANVLTTAATSSATNQSNHALRELNSNFVLGGFGVGASSMAAAQYRGILTASTSGTFSIQYAQNTADPTDLIVRAGSHLSHRSAA